MCGSFHQAFESTSHIPRNMVIGKLKYLIGPATGTIIHPLGRSRFYFFSGRTGAEWSDSVVGEGTPCPWTGEERGTVAWAKVKSIPMRVV